MDKDTLQYHKHSIIFIIGDNVNFGLVQKLQNLTELTPILD